MAYFAIYFGGYMKRSSIFTKIMLAMVLLALVFALVACNGGGDDEDTEPTPPPEEEATLAEQLVDIIKAAGPLITTINGIEAGSTVSADVTATVDYKNGASSGNYSVALAGNINSTSPELTANFKKGSTEWLGLTYVGNEVYLNQPLTAVNTSSDHDKIFADVAALEPAVNDIMYIVMDALAGLNINIDFDELATSLGGLIGQFDETGAISDMIQIETTSTGNKITLTSATLSSLLPVIKMALSDLSDIIDAIVPETLPDITAEIRHNETDGITGLKLAYKFDDDNQGSLDLDLSLSTSSKVTVSAPSGYTNKPLVANLSASLPQKGAEVDLGLIVNPDFSAKGKNLALATAAINGEHLVNGFFDGQAVYFDTGALYDALNVTKPADTQYKATLQKGEVEALTATTLVDMINEGAKSVKDKYIANKGKEDGSSSGSTDTAAPSKGILVTIYEWLGGTASIEEGAYVDPTEAEMLKALDNNIGEYVRFNVDEDEYYKVLKNILNLFNNNEEWLIGVDLIKNDFAGKINSMTDFITFNNWINTVTIEEGKTKFGIFDWDTATWSGGATLTKAGANNDFLDAVNVFVCLGLDAENKPIDITSDNISEFMNYYIAALGYYVDGFYSPEQMQAIDAADKKLLIAKNVYLNSNKTEDDAQALAAAEAAHKTELEKYYTAANANRVIAMLIGYTGTTDNYLKELIDGGIYVGIGCNKDKGLNGYIDLASDNTKATVYATIAGSIGFFDIEQSIDELVSAITINKEAAQELYAPEVTTDEAYKVIDTWEDGTLKVNADGSYVYKKDGDNFVYSYRYANGEKLLDELYSAFIGYMNYEKAA